MHGCRPPNILTLHETHPIAMWSQSTCDPLQCRGYGPMSDQEIALVHAFRGRVREERSRSSLIIKC